MDFIGTTLVTLNEPTGFWQSILSAFKNGMGTYILAVIMIAVIVRVLFSLVDIINKKVTMKNSEINAKMKPELDAIKQKYGNDPAMLQQKTNEIYKKYQFSMMSSCLPMIIMLVLQFTVFLTLWNSLQSVASYNIVNQYQNMKNIYANVISLNENSDILSALESGYEDGDQLTIQIYTDETDGLQYMQLKVSKDNGETFENLGDAVLFDEELASSNEEVYKLLATYVIEESEEENNNEEELTSQEEDNLGEVQEEIVYSPTAYSEVLKLLAEDAVREYYLNTQEGFLWIKNIYKSESPTSPLFTKSEIIDYMSDYYSDEEQLAEDEYSYEEAIFDCIIGNNSQLEDIENQKNGYYILTIIAVLVCVLSMWLSNRLMRNKNAPPQKQSWIMYVVMALIYGIFTFMYTSLFAIYLIVGQLIMMLLTPLTTLIVRKWNDHDMKKKQDKNVIEVDYRRKDI